jgi:hypothetical protein
MASARASLRLLLRLSTDSCGEGGENSDIIRGAAAAVAVKSTFTVDHTSTYVIA